MIRKSAATASLDGAMTETRCPWCKRRLMANQAGAVWCSNIECEYHTRHGRAVRYQREICHG